MSLNSNIPFIVHSPNVEYSDSHIKALYTHQAVEVLENTARLREEKFTIQTERKVPKVGLLLVGWGGNNGTTVAAGIIANKLGMKWRTKEGVKSANYFGSLTQSSTVKVGHDTHTGQSVYLPFNSIVPLVHPNDLVLGGWDISKMNLADAMQRAEVLDYDLQRQLRPHLERLVPLPSIYDPSFIAGNQSDRADNLLPCTTKREQLAALRGDIAQFRQQHALDKVVVLWTATTERYVQVQQGVHDTAANLLQAVEDDVAEISPSILFALAAVLEQAAFINGSPQNTLVPGLVALAQERGVFLVGDDLKSGQTKLKSDLVDFFISSGLKPVSIVSYNHLGNNDGRNLSAPEQFRSKEISKASVIDDMVQSNGILYQPDDHVDHVVVIKYVPYVKDSKRALDEYTNEIFMHGKNTLVIHNTCEDSLLASPLILDLCILTELCQRVSVTNLSTGREERFHSVLSLLSYFMKAPAVPEGCGVVNALTSQRQALTGLLRACVGLPAEDPLDLQHRLPSLIKRPRAEDGEGGEAEAAKRQKQ